MPRVPGQFRSERALVEAFCAVIRSRRSPWGRLRTAREFGYLRGCADVVGLAMDGAVIAFEAKLRRWREALDQAYRNTCFAHESYVVMPETMAALARRIDVYEFERRSVGLCFVRGGTVVMRLRAKRIDPIEPWLAEAAQAAAGGG